MDNRRVGLKGPAVVGSSWADQGSFEIAMRLAAAINHAVVATENVARAILVAAACLVIYYAADREPPFAVLSVEPASAYPGGAVVFRAKVARQVDRNCSASVVSFAFDSAGTRHEVYRGVDPAAMIQRADKLSPGELKVSLRLPDTIEPGPASLLTIREYECNKTHRLVPIEVTTNWPFTVLPLP